MTKLQAENCELKWELKFLRKQLKNSSLAIEGYEFKINKLMGHNYTKDDIILELENKKDLHEVELLLKPLGYTCVKKNKHDIIWACK